jgi:two-component system, NarL family, invasion response regulator UvrY
MTCKLKVAVVDDHAMICEGIKKYLEPHVEVVIVAHDGYTFLEQLKVCTSTPDICILDINMPILNGFDTAKRLKAEWPSVKVLTFSMHHHEYTILKMIRLGAVGYLDKDAPPHELLEAVNSINDTGYYHSELVETMIKKDKKEYIKNIAPREEEFLQYCCTELAYKEIATLMGVSDRTVHAFRLSLAEKFSIKTRPALALFAIQVGLIGFSHPILREEKYKFSH